MGVHIIIYCCPVNNNSPLYCFVVQCFIAIFTKGACLYTMRAALGFAACQSKKGNTLIIRLLPFQGGWRCGDIMLTQGDALGYVLLGFQPVFDLIISFTEQQ